MPKTTISKIKYKRFKKRANVFEEAVKDFRETNLYSEEFLKDLKSGLKKSSYFTSSKCKI